METDTIILIVAIILLYVLFPIWVIIQNKKDEERYKNMPPELWRVNQWHLFDKQRVYSFLKADLKELKKVPIRDKK